MRNEDKLIKVAHYNTKLNSVLGFDYSAFTIYRSKGLLTLLIKRKHYIATVFDVKKGKIDSYVKSGRLVPICSNIFG